MVSDVKHLSYLVVLDFVEVAEDHGNSHGYFISIIANGDLIKTNLLSQYSCFSLYIDFHLGVLRSISIHTLSQLSKTISILPFLPSHLCSTDTCLSTVHSLSNNSQIISSKSVAFISE